MPIQRIAAPQTSHVCIRYGDGAHHFRFVHGMTFGELAVHIEAFAALHDRAPLTIDVVLEAADRPKLQASGPNIVTH